MGIKRIKVSTYVDIDDIKEKDLEKTLQDMIDSRQLSTFSTNAIKLVLENPELLNRCRVGEKQMLSSREVFFNELSTKVKELENTQLYLEGELQKIVEFIRLRKMIGVEEKLDNVACSQFLVKRQIKALNKQLGRISSDLVTDRRSVEPDIIEMTKKADELVEFTINHYDGIINELKSMMTINVPIQERVIVETKVDSNTESSVETAADVRLNTEVTKETDKNEPVDNLSVLLANSDAMDALEDMFGF